MAYVRRRRENEFPNSDAREPLIEFPNSDAFICRVCKTYIAMLDHLVGRISPDIEPFLGIKNQIKDPTVFLQHVFNSEFGNSERRFFYIGKPIACRTCHACLGYRIERVTDSINDFIYDFEPEPGYFELDTTKLYIRLSNGEFRNAEIMEHVAEIPRPFHYTPARNFFVCSTCNVHLALEREVISGLLNINMEAVFIDIHGMENVHLGAPNTRLGVRTVTVYCSGCFKSLGYMIAELRDVKFTDPFTKNGRLVLDMRKMEFCCRGRLYYLCIAAHRLTNAADTRLDADDHNLRDDLAYFYYIK